MVANDSYLLGGWRRRRVMRPRLGTRHGSCGGSPAMLIGWGATPDEMRTMTKRHHLTLLALALAAITGLWACGPAESAGDPDAELCAAADVQMQQCFGATAAGVFADGCDLATASRVVDLECEALASMFLDGKADDILGEAVKDAIWTAIREGVKVAMEQVIAAVVEAVGGNLDDFAFYLVFHEAADADAAQQMATAIGDILADEPAVSPLVYELSGSWYVLHGPCPLDLRSDVAGLIATIIVDHPELVQLLGGSVTQNGTGTEVDISLPLAILPGPLTLPAELGCP